jgi:hypothetical protein
MAQRVVPIRCAAWFFPAVARLMAPGSAGNGPAGGAAADGRESWPRPRRGPPVAFGEPVPGREKDALDYAAEAEEYWGKLAADGKCTAPEWFVTIGGKGLWMVKGERAVLESYALSDAGRGLLAKGDLLLDDFDFHVRARGQRCRRVHDVVRGGGVRARHPLTGPRKTISRGARYDL